VLQRESSSVHATSALVFDFVHICQASLNSLENSSDLLANYLMSGRWDVVLPEVTGLKMPKDKLQDLYVDVIMDLVELCELDAARTLMYRSDTMSRLRLENPKRVSRLERFICGLSSTSTEALKIPGGSRGQRRLKVAQDLSSEIDFSSPSRMLVMLGRSFTLSHQVGFPTTTSSLKSLPGILETRSAEDFFPFVEHRVISLGKKSSPLCMCFSPDGFLIAVGFADGFVELWDWDGGIIHTSKGLMFHDARVLALEFSLNGDMLASACQRGKIKVWKVDSGQILRNFDRAHSRGITSVAFSPDGNHILSASTDATLRIHGLKSGRIIRDLRGHAGCVNTACFLADGARVLSASSDGTVRLWNAKSSDTIATFKPVNSGSSSRLRTTVISALPLRDSQHCLVCTGSGNVDLMTLTGILIRSYCPESQGKNFIAFAPSPRARHVHALTEEGNICSFNASSGKLVNVLRTQDVEVNDFCHHSFSNVLAAISSSGTLRVWKTSSDIGADGNV